MNQELRIYTDTIKTRFNDLDAYGHVNSSQYLDYVVSSRWHYCEMNLNISAKDLLQKNLGFYLINSNINYKRSIHGPSEIKIRSWVSKNESKYLTVDFVIEDKDDKLLSDGQLKFAVMDLKLGRTQALPDWAKTLFWK